MEEQITKTEVYNLINPIHESLFEIGKVIRKLTIELEQIDKKLKTIEPLVYENSLKEE